MHQLAVGDDLVSRLDAQQVTRRDLVDGNGSRDPVANDGCSGRDERSEAVERALRADLLRDPDRRVREQDAEEERVLPLAKHERRSAGDGEDEVEDREDVGADDARVRAARRLDVRLPVRE